MSEAEHFTMMLAEVLPTFSDKWPQDMRNRWMDSFDLALQLAFDLDMPARAESEALEPIHGEEMRTERAPGDCREEVECMEAEVRRLCEQLEHLQRTNSEMLSALRKGGSYGNGAPKDYVDVDGPLLLRLVADRLIDKKIEIGAYDLLNDKADAEEAAIKLATEGQVRVQEA